MQNPFSSEYVSPHDIRTTTTSANTIGETGMAATNIPVGSEAASRSYGFEPERYGSGKPRRVVIRGAITRE